MTPAAPTPLPAGLRGIPVAMATARPQPATVAACRAESVSRVVALVCCWSPQVWMLADTLRADLWDHRNASLREWLINEFILGPTGLGNVNISVRVQLLQ